MTKFVVLCPIERKTAEEVASQLFHIFSLLGAQQVLQIDSGREFRMLIWRN